MSQPPAAVTYADGRTPVLLGDRVTLRHFFRRRPGEVIYVPGISKRQGTYEHDGLTWVGISLPKGWAVGSIVLPETGRLQKSVRFVARGEESAEAAVAKERIRDQEVEEDALIAEREANERLPATKPKAMDWLAGLTAVTLQLLLILGFFGVIFFVVWLLRRLF